MISARKTPPATPDRVIEPYKSCRAESILGIGTRRIGGITLSDGEGRGERTPTRPILRGSDRLAGWSGAAPYRTFCRAGAWVR
jgi:hypothetical protein